ncbi:MAG: hypothetical protein UY13_C0002G0279 [Candidatus Pacebacteria bacterium GW2011_GWB1_47_8]|nr:MAG: hypothetical protein UX28_C0001G0427 [Candidatus Pacebacteria bacterium GW2011_GWA1_46_10]KKU84367.1 MAG: hypothetical protein UY13_C0002G0279 [Candidatus Pacebacteria bacterium GW2011_GWB1_47_8]HCR81207.1 hypothetical protein [Candidatus Paceibacterota bacterium]
MKLLIRFRWKYFGLIGVLGLLLGGWFFGRFIDEQENMVGGWLIAQGWVIYRDFFLHHTPLPYFISSLLFMIGQPMGWWWRAVTLLYVLMVGRVIWSNADHQLQPSIILTGLLLGLAAPRLNLNMYLADSFFAVSFLGSVILLWQYWQFRPARFHFTLKWLLFFWFVSGWSTIVAVPPFLVLLAILFGLEYRRKKSWLTLWQASRKPLGWFLGLVSIFPLYFWLSGALNDFVWSTVTYNQQYYFPLRLAETAGERQWGAFYYSYLRFGSLIIEQGRLIFQTALTFLQTLGGMMLAVSLILIAQLTRLLLVWLTTPVTTLAADALTVLAVGWWAIALSLLWRQRWQLLLVMFVLSGLLYMRNNEVFHLSVLFLTLFWLISFWWVSSWQQRRLPRVFFWSFVLLVIITYFAPSYLEHVRHRFPIITPAQRQQAQRIKTLSQPGEKLQVVGGDLTYYWLSNRLPAGETIIYYPWFQPVERIRQPLLTTLTEQTAQLVILAEPFDRELVEILETNYSKKEQGLYQPLK